MLPLSYMENENLYCHDLLSQPLPDMKNILVTGASGYIGGRLVYELYARGYNVKVMVRASSPEYFVKWPYAEVIVADALDQDDMMRAMKDVDAAYYLMHSLLHVSKNFENEEVVSAVNFRNAAEKNKVKRIFYLGDIQTRLLPHLRNRLAVAEELDKGSVPLTTLRASLIIGSGSASFELISHLVKKLPIFLVPYWANKNKCQPIAVKDVVKYLVGILESRDTADKSFDIGGDETLTYETVLENFAEIYKLKKIYISIPFSNSWFFSYMASLLTPVPTPISRYLIDGFKKSTICNDNSIEKYITLNKFTLREAIIKAMGREDQDRIYTRWSDAYPPAHELAIKLKELPDYPEYTAEYSFETEKSAESLFHSICKVGGKDGWFSNNWMWRLRGFLDKIVFGVGQARGRKSQTSLKINDVIGFWRIEDFVPEKRLLLRAEMKVPGKAWLEFKITDNIDKRVLTVKPYFQTKSLYGKIYWYFFVPFHTIIFNDLIEQIEKRS